jgi:adenylosuccinate synthase
MTKRATVVIGANFGDEGKGLLTDFYCAEPGPSATVVRFNGGAQAGHTVNMGHGRSHVFHHIGAGAFRGAQTFLSRHFIANPMLMLEERRLLDRRFGLKPIVAVDRAAALTTPYDMLINQAAEISRGRGRHGSCGVGINETVHRAASGFATTVGDVGDLAALRSRLEDIRIYYVPSRLEELGIAEIDPTIQRALDAPSLAAAFVEACAEFDRQSIIVDGSYLDDCEDVVFEGAQGLLLDEKHRFFPHVTRSRTGLTNVVDLAGPAGIRELRIVYVTRSYMTRHGAGPFPTEDWHFRLPDETNVPHPFQGTLRFGSLDLDLLSESIRTDLARGDGFLLRPAIAVTHLDQKHWRIAQHHGVRTLHDKGDEAFVREIMDAAGLDRALASYGSRATDIIGVAGIDFGFRAA